MPLSINGVGTTVDSLFQMSQLNDSHRLFIQCIMNRGILDHAEVKRLYGLFRTKFQEDADEAHLAQFVLTASRALAPFHMEIKKAVEEVAGTHFYVLINTVEAPFHQLAADFSEKELEFFKALVEKVIESDEGLLPEVDALNLADGMQFKKLSKKEAEAAILKLAGRKWLNTEDANGQLHVTLSARSITELGQYLRELYPDSVRDCNLCKRLCIRGQCCSECSCKIHVSCSRRYFEQRQGSAACCPDCSVSWPHPTIPTQSVGDEEVHSTITITSNNPRKRPSSNARQV